MGSPVGEKGSTYPPDMINFEHFMWSLVRVVFDVDHHVAPWYTFWIPATPGRLPGIAAALNTSQLNNHTVWIIATMSWLTRNAAVLRIKALSKDCDEKADVDGGGVCVCHGGTVLPHALPGVQVRCGRTTNASDALMRPHTEWW